MRDERVMVVVEGLEGRRMMSTATFYTSGSAAGHLIVRGDQGKANIILLRMVNNGTEFEVTHNGKKQVFKVDGVEKLYVFGGKKDDTIKIQDKGKRIFTFDVNLEGRGGNDTIVGGAGNDTIIGGAGDDVLYGGLGDDQLTGDDGDDSVYGGLPTDTFDDGADTLWGGNGDDLMVGGSWYDTLFGEAGNDRMYGGFVNAASNRRGDASDDMFGDDGDDFMDAGMGGRNRMHGLNGNDTLVGGPDNDTLYGGAGDNKLTDRGGQLIGERNGEWQGIFYLLRKITPEKPTPPNSGK